MLTCYILDEVLLINSVNDSNTYRWWQSGRRCITQAGGGRLKDTPPGALNRSHELVTCRSLRLLQHKTVLE